MTVELRPLGEMLTVVQHEGKEYLGMYAKNLHPTLDEVRATMHELSSLLERYKAEVPSRAPQIVVFPQLFVG